MKTIKIHDNLKLKTSELFAKVKEKYGGGWSCWSDEELDKQFPIPKEETTRYFLDEVEPNTATLGKSAIEADPNQDGITLRERLLLDLATDKKIDVKGVTFCSGSRTSDGYVPLVYLDRDGEVEVYWYYADHCYPSHGVRRAVTLNTQPLNTSEEKLATAIKLLVDSGYSVYKN